MHPASFAADDEAERASPVPSPLAPAGMDVEQGPLTPVADDGVEQAHRTPSPCASAGEEAEPARPTPSPRGLADAEAEQASPTPSPFGSIAGDEGPPTPGPFGPVEANEGSDREAGGEGNAFEEMLGFSSDEDAAPASPATVVDDAAVVPPPCPQPSAEVEERLTIDFRKVLRIPGVLHIVHNATEAMFTSMS